MSTDNIQVIVRIRPFSLQETTEQEKSCIMLSNETNNSIILDSKPDQKIFSFDNVIRQDQDQEEVYKILGKSNIDICLNGYNACIFAYGQTGSGKTFTMSGKNFECNSPQRGLIPRVLENFFIECQKKKNEFEGHLEYLIKCSYFEIYNEQIIDLLSNSNSKNLQIREDLKKGIYVEGLIEEFIMNSQEAIGFLNKGTRNRHVGSTQLNFESSRSHSVCSLTVEQKKTKNGLTNVYVSKIHLVDLAGSERQKLTATVGNRLKEASNINKSLTVLGCVINSLVDSSRGKLKHIPYRDSKLTFILRDSLGGNSKTSMIANISASSSSFQETLSTLKFAQRAKKIKNKALVNEESSGNVNILQREIKKLKDELNKAKNIIVQFEIGNKNSLSKDYILQQESSNDRMILQQQQDLLREINEKTIEMEKYFNQTLEILKDNEIIYQTQMEKKDYQIIDMKSKLQIFINNEVQFRTLIKLYEEKQQFRTQSKFGDIAEEKYQDIVEENKILKEILGQNQIFSKIYLQNQDMQEFLDNFDYKGPCTTISFEDSLNTNIDILKSICQKIEENLQDRKKMLQYSKEIDLMSIYTSEGISDSVDIKSEQKQDKLQKELQESHEESQRQKKEIQHLQRLLKRKRNEKNRCLQELRLTRRLKFSQNQKKNRELDYYIQELEKMRISKQEEQNNLNEQIEYQYQRVEEYWLCNHNWIQERRKLNELVMRQGEDIQIMNMQKYQQQEQILQKEQIIRGIQLEKEAIREDFEQQKEQNNILNQQIMELKNQIENAEQENRDKLAQAEQFVQNLQENKLQLEAEKNKLQEEIDTLVLSCDYLERQVDEKSKDLNQIKLTVQEKDIQIQQQDFKIKELGLMLQQYEEKEKSKSKSSFIKDHKLILEQNQNLQQELQHQKVHNSQLNITAENLKEEVKNLRISEVYFKQVNKDLSENNIQIQQKFDDIQQNMILKDQENSQLIKDLKTLNKKHKLNQKKIQSLEQKIQKQMTKTHIAQQDFQSQREKLQYLQEKMHYQLNNSKKKLERVKKEKNLLEDHESSKVSTKISNENQQLNLCIYLFKKLLNNLDMCNQTSLLQQEFPDEFLQQFWNEIQIVSNYQNQIQESIKQVQVIQKQLKEFNLYPAKQIYQQANQREFQKKLRVLQEQIDSIQSIKQKKFKNNDYSDSEKSSVDAIQGESLESMEEDQEIFIVAIFEIIKKIFLELEEISDQNEQPNKILLIKQKSLNQDMENLKTLYIKFQKDIVKDFQKTSQYSNNHKKYINSIENFGKIIISSIQKYKQSIQDCGRMKQDLYFEDIDINCSQEEKIFNQQQNSVKSQKNCKRSLKIDDSNKKNLNKTNNQLQTKKKCPHFNEEIDNNFYDQNQISNKKILCKILTDRTNTFDDQLEDENKENAEIFLGKQTKKKIKINNKSKEISQNSKVKNL